jgi:hypothetical protein
MIRVVIRHINDAEGTLVGDFPPADIPELVDFIRRTPLYMGDESDYAQLADLDTGLPLQLIVAEGSTPRLVLEVIVEDN